MPNGISLVRRGAIATSQAPVGVPALVLPGVAGNYASTPDAAANSITGNIDLRIRCSALWATGTQMLVTKFFNAGGRAYQIFSLNGTFYFDQSNLGSNTWQNGAAHGLADGAVAWLRATYRQSDRRVQLFKSTAETETGWVQFGGDMTGVTGPMFDPAGVQLRIGTNTDAQGPLNGTVYEAKIYASLDETDLRVHFKPSVVTVVGTRNPATFVGVTGETWTLNGVAWDWGWV